jgi:hypothetical protein
MFISTFIFQSQVLEFLDLIFAACSNTLTQSNSIIMVGSPSINDDVDKIIFTVPLSCPYCTCLFLYVVLAFLVKRDTYHIYLNGR